VDSLVVVSAQLLLLFLAPRSQRLLEVALLVLAADHEANLTGGVGWYGGVCVFDVRENLEAIFLQVGDEGKVEPLVLGYK
jgi:hypothetical protein